MGQQSFREYERELQASSGPDFQMRLLNSNSDKREDVDSDSKALTDAIELEVHNSFLGLVIKKDTGDAVELSSKLQRSVEDIFLTFCTLLTSLMISRATSLDSIQCSWPLFSGTYEELEAVAGRFETFTFNALDYSDNDLTVIIGQMFHQVYRDSAAGSACS
jgi:hypothetical protein